MHAPGRIAANAGKDLSVTSGFHPRQASEQLPPHLAERPLSGCASGPGTTAMGAERTPGRPALYVRNHPSRRFPPVFDPIRTSILGESISYGHDVIDRENCGGVEGDVVMALGVPLEYSCQNVDHRDHSRPREKRETEWLAHSSAPHCILLNRHQGSKREHAAYIADTHDEHEQHDGPATADAPSAMRQAKAERVLPWVRAMPMAHDEAKRCAALVQAMILQPRELKCPCQTQDNSAGCPRVRGEPDPATEPSMQHAVQQMRGHAEPCPG